jgi:single-stranded-DNA-specific exonuclease
MPNAPLYRLASRISPEILANFAGFTPLVQQLLHTRGVTTKEDAETFFAPQYETLHDPFLMTDMEKAVTRILSALENKERIVVFSDYDCDGIPGGVLLHDFLTAIGCTNFENHIPHRHVEGYGLTISAIDMLAERGAKVIITVDCGITDVAPAARAKEQSIDLIITDHHEVGLQLPDAYAILNPKRDDAYPFKGLCGTGVAWKLVQALQKRGAETGQTDLMPGAEKWWLDVVGLATIADRVPLMDENRTLAHFGLKVLQKTRRPGLQHLFRVMRVNQKYLTEDDVGFMIGPRINAASRMDTPEDAFQMLATTDEAAAGAHARHLEALNNERKGVVAAMVKEVKKRIAQSTAMSPVIVMGNPEWRPALVGLVANTLCETFARPVFLWGRDGRDVIKGSCRSDGITSVVSLMHEVRDVFIEYGGHHASGGFSVRGEHIHTFDARLNDAYAAMGAAATAAAPEIIVDAVLSLDEISDHFMREIMKLAPFGEGNDKPLFAFPSVVPEQVFSFGKGKDHTKAVFKTKHGPLEAVAFFTPPDEFAAPLKSGAAVTLIAHAEQSFFMNRLATRLRIVDVLPPDYVLC